MIRINFQVGKEEWFSAWSGASTAWFHRHENGIDLFQLLRVIELQYPSLLGRVVLVEDAKARSLLPVSSAAAPGLKCAGTPKPSLLVEVIRVEHERFSFGIEDPAIRFLRLPIPRNVVYL